MWEVRGGDEDAEAGTGKRGDGGKREEKREEKRRGKKEGD